MYWKEESIKCQIENKSLFIYNLAPEYFCDLGKSTKFATRNALYKSGSKKDFKAFIN